MRNYTSSHWQLLHKNNASLSLQVTATADFHISQNINSSFKKKKKKNKMKAYASGIIHRAPLNNTKNN